MKTALVIGASGLVGRQCIYQLIEEKHYIKVIALLRTEVNIKHHKLEQVIVDFDRLDKFTDKINADDIYCCMGTTIKTAGSNENFRKVDFEYPLNTALLAHKNGASQFLLVSSMGADKDSSVFYTRVKGELEEALSKTGYKSVHIFRPSLLLGDRKEFRLGELIAKKIMSMISFGFIGYLSKYKPVKDIAVAKAMVKIGVEANEGIHIYESDQIQKMA